MRIGRRSGSKNRVDARLFLVFCLSVGLTAGIVLGNGGDGEGFKEPLGGILVASQVGYGCATGSPLAMECADGGLSTATIGVLDAPPTPVPPLPGDAPSRQGIRETADEETAGTPSVVSGREPEFAEGAIASYDTRPVLAAVSYSVLGEIVAAYDWPINEAFQVVDCESSWDAGAVSWAGSYGLMQLHAATWAPIFPDFWERWDDPEWNVATAWEIYKRADYSWTPWDCW